MRFRSAKFEQEERSISVSVEAYEYESESLGITALLYSGIALLHYKAYSRELEKIAIMVSEEGRPFFITFATMFGTRLDFIVEMHWCCVRVKEKMNYIESEVKIDKARKANNAVIAFNAILV